MVTQRWFCAARVALLLGAFLSRSLGVRPAVSGPGDCTSHSECRETAPFCLGYEEDGAEAQECASRCFYDEDGLSEDDRECVTGECILGECVEEVRDTIPCLLFIDQGGGSFTGYAFNGETGKVLKNKCKSKELVKTFKPEGLKPYIDEADGTFKAYDSDVVQKSGSLVSTLVDGFTDLYLECFQQMGLAKTCKSFSSVLVRQTGKLRAALLGSSAAPDKKTKKQWETNMEDMMGKKFATIIEKSAKKPTVSFEFLSNEDEAQFEGMDFFSASSSKLRIPKDEAKEGKAEPLDLTTLLALSIGSSSTQAYTWTGDSVKSHFDTLLGAKPDKRGKFQVKNPVESFKQIIDTLKTATQFEVVIALGAIGHVMADVLAWVFRCACDSTPREEQEKWMKRRAATDSQKCPAEKNDEQCQLAQRITKQIRNWEKIPAVDMNEFAAWPDQAFGDVPPLPQMQMLHALAQACEQAKIPYIIMEGAGPLDTDFPVEAKWVKGLVVKWLASSRAASS